MIGARKLTAFFGFLIQRRYLIYELVKRDLTVNYAGSWLGILWNFLHPAALVFIYWFIFSFGLKVKPRSDLPFLVWLVAGISIWFTFRDIVIGSTKLITGNANLVKKIVFPYHVLPVIKLFSALFYHAFFLCILLFLIWLHDLPFRLLMFQFVYFYACMSFLALGIGLITSSMNVFLRDTSQFVSIIVQFCFWGTPIFWDIGIMPPQVQKLLVLNPIYYFVQGYRDSFLNFVPAWHHPVLTLFFWMVSLTVFCIGILVFRRLKNHFAEVI